MCRLDNQYPRGQISKLGETSKKTSRALSCQLCIFKCCYLQYVRFHHPEGCMPCKQLSEPQRSTIQETKTFTRTFHLFTVGVQGEIYSISLKSNVSKLPVHVGWTKSDVMESNDENAGECGWRADFSPITDRFPRFSGKNKISFFKTFSNGVTYHFFKYMDQTIVLTVDPDRAKTHPHSVLGLGQLPKCEQVSHKPRFFSWYGTKRLCHRAAASLPSFISRVHQEEFLHILKASTDIFPLEAVYIALQQHHTASKVIVPTRLSKLHFCA